MLADMYPPGLGSTWRTACVYCSSVISGGMGSGEVSNPKVTIQAGHVTARYEIRRNSEHSGICTPTTLLPPTVRPTTVQ